MHRSTRIKTQKTKKWFKPKKVNKKNVIMEVGKYTYHDDDFLLTQWTTYGGINHTNRDRKGGHIRSRHRSDYFEMNHKKNRHIKDNKYWVSLGLEDLRDQDCDAWFGMFDDPYDEYDYYYGDNWTEYQTNMKGRGSQQDIQDYRNALYLQDLADSDDDYDYGYDPYEDFIDYELDY